MPTDNNDWTMPADRAREIVERFRERYTSVPFPVTEDDRRRITPFSR